MTESPAVSIEGFTNVNFGDVLMARACEALVHEVLPDATVYFAKSLAGPTHRTSRLERVWKHRILRRPPELPAYRLSARALYDDNVRTALFCNGYMLGGHWPRSLAESLLDQFTTAKRRGKSVVLMPQSFGPFKEDWHADVIGRVIDVVDLAFARDRKSFEYLSALLPQSRKIRVATDYTPLIPHTVRPASNHAVLIPNIKIHEVYGAEAGDRYLHFLLKAASRLEQAGCAVRVLEHTMHKDTRIIAELRSRGLKIAEVGYDPVRARDYIGGARFVLSSRFHGVVNALAQGVPTVAIGWTHKYDEVMAQYQVTAFNMPWNGGVELTVLDYLIERERDTRELLKRTSAAVRAALSQSLVAPLRDLLVANTLR